MKMLHWPPDVSIRGLAGLIVDIIKSGDLVRRKNPPLRVQIAVQTSSRSSELSETRGLLPVDSGVGRFFGPSIFEVLICGRVETLRTEVNLQRSYDSPIVCYGGH